MEEKQSQDASMDAFKSFLDSRSCLKCKHEWKKRGDAEPVCCPRCKSPKWNDADPPRRPLTMASVYRWLTELNWPKNVYLSFSDIHFLHNAAGVYRVGVDDKGEYTEIYYTKFRTKINEEDRIEELDLSDSSFADVVA